MESAVETLCGQEYETGKYEMVGVYLQRSTILLMSTGVPLTIIYIFCKPSLIFLGESLAIAAAASVFVYGVIPRYSPKQQTFLYINSYKLKAS